MVVLGGLAHFCASALIWLRGREAEYIADSRGAALLDDEQDFADMAILLECASMLQIGRVDFAIKTQEQAAALSAASRGGDGGDNAPPGMVFGALDVHPNTLSRIRQLRPSFDGDYRRAYFEIMSRLSRQPQTRNNA